MEQVAAAAELSDLVGFSQTTQLFKLSPFLALW
jgi:hypothetical protein